MIDIVAQFMVKSDKVAEFIEQCQPLVQQSRQEAGCISYELQQNTDKPNHLVFLEKWKSKEAIEQHSASAHFTSIVPILVSLSEEDPNIQTFTQVL